MPGISDGQLLCKQPVTGRAAPALSVTGGRRIGEFLAAAASTDHQALLTRAQEDLLLPQR